MKARRSIKLDLQPFTLVGPRPGRACSPTRCVTVSASSLGWSSTPPKSCAASSRGPAGCWAPIQPEGALEIAQRSSRGTPRIANRLLRVRDCAEVKGDGTITRDIAEDRALAMLDVDPVGFDLMDRKLLPRPLLHKFDGGPVGLDNLAAAIGEERDTIEDVIEPFLIQQGFLQRTPRPGGHLAAWRHLGLTPPNSRGDLFDTAGTGA